MTVTPEVTPDMVDIVYAAIDFFSHDDSGIREALAEVLALHTTRLREDVLQRNLALDSAHEELAQYRREIDHIRQRFLVGRDPAEVFTVGELLAVFRDGPPPATPGVDRRHAGLELPCDQCDGPCTIDDEPDGAQ